MTDSTTTRDTMDAMPADIPVTICPPASAVSPRFCNMGKTLGKAQAD